MNTYPSLPQQLRQLREERGLSQAALATLAGTSQQTIDRIERNLNSPSLSTLESILAALQSHLTVIKNEENIKSTIKMKDYSIWLTSFEDGEATLYVDNASDGSTIAKCTILESYNYTAANLQQLLGVAKRYPELNDICHEIYDHNKSVFLANKDAYALTYGSASADELFGKYPSFAKLMQTRPAEV